MPRIMIALPLVIVTLLGVIGEYALTQGGPHPQKPHPEPLVSPASRSVGSSQSRPQATGWKWWS
jgi:hypothetical protein